VHLTETACNWIARSFVDTDHLGQLLQDKLLRYLTESEAGDLLPLLTDAVASVLVDFDFIEPDQVPKVDSNELWAYDHAGKAYRRPKGKVIYTVTGDVMWHGHSIRPRAVPMVIRSSDGESIPMTITDLEAMVEVTVTEQE